MSSAYMASVWVANLTRQAAFTRGYSPLYAAILDHLAAWLRQTPVAGSREARLQRRFATFVTSRPWDSDLLPILKLAAALHSYVLAADPRVDSLRHYYHTVTTPAHDPADAAFGEALLHALDTLGNALLDRANDWEIQTNETARGVLWLVPAALLQIEAAHLVEFGASAGLNLLADHRRFDLHWPDGTTVQLGLATTPQFEVQCDGPTAGLHGQLAPPEILSRVGADIQVLDLDAPHAEQQLAACVWGDQPQRMLRLQEALRLRRELRHAASVVRSHLPDDTAEFLQAAIPSVPLAPVILYDTYVTAYFNDVDHRALIRAVEAFARPWTLRHGLPWLWVRFEPPRVGETKAPQTGWCRWWAEVWTQGKHRQIELGWGHPHCIRLQLGPGLVQLAELRGPSAGGTE